MKVEVNRLVTTMLTVLLTLLGIFSVVTGVTQNFALRLNNSFGNSSSEGRLEIYYEGSWGTVCDDLFTDYSARVACASLGYGYSGVVSETRHEGGTGQIWLDDVECNGTESGIEQCPHNQWGVHNCSHNEDVSISCECVGRNFSEPTGRISSPNFPNPYPNNLNCNNYISVSSGHVLVVTFSVLNIELDFDWITITCESGEGFNSSSYTGYAIPTVLRIFSCSLVNVRLQTDEDVSFMGFSLTYNTTSDCASRNFSEPTGSISSPNFPNLYPSNQDCNNYISVSSGQALIAVFSEINTEPGYDWVTITCESGSVYTSPRYSGSIIPPAVVIYSCSLVNVRFHTDGSVSGAGFNLTYFNYTTTSDFVGRNFSEPTGRISSPNFPNEYPNNLDCNNYISVSSGHTIVITFSAFDTEPGYDWVNITCESGAVFNSPTYSGSVIPSAVTISSCNLVNVRFYTDPSVSKKGFSLTYTTISDCASRDFYEPTGRISSQNFPNAYADNLDCSNYISVSSGQTIVITFLAFDTEPDNDWVTITCESGNIFNSPRYSGFDFPPVLTVSSCYLLNVRFRTDNAVTKTGFSLAYNTISDTVIGGITTKPSDVFPGSDKDSRIIFNCTSTSKYLPWWTVNGKSSGNYTLTNSSCGVITSAPYGSSFSTETLGSGSCNLIVVAPSNSLKLLADSLTCTDSTLASARSLIIPMSPELYLANGMQSGARLTDIVKDEEIRISCNPSFVDQNSNRSVIFAHEAYSGGPVVQIRILKTYWTSQGEVITGTNTSVTSSYVVVKASNGVIPRYTCHIVLDFFSNISAMSQSVATEPTFSTEPVQVLFWPSEENITISGHRNGQIQFPGLLSCYVPANPPATYQWIDESNGYVTNGPTLTILQGGKYTCNASNFIRGQYYEESKSIDLKEYDAHQLNIQAIILGTLLGVAVVIITIVLAFLIVRKCRQQKPNRPTAAVFGRANRYEERELEQNRRSNRCESGFGFPVDDADEYDKLDIAQRIPPAIPTVYQGLKPTSQN